ncbi:MAG: hypothetical protein F6K14_24875 [Symploca sp. SIO2C1]|nr:hypothetical protein [Symploca sp. SIO2C1]
MAITKSSKKLVKTQKLLEEEGREQERINNILLLLEHLIEREEITVKSILDCLYDVGSVNLINKKIPVQLLNSMMKFIARLSKPAFRMVALYWFKKNCPQLITNWLHKKVSFKDAKKTVSNVVDVSIDPSAEVETCKQEIKHLRSQVKLLAGSLIAVIVFFMTTSFN